jgi:hypothetical protein
MKDCRNIIQAYYFSSLRVPSSSAVVFYPSMLPEQQQPLLDMKVEAEK